MTLVVSICNIGMPDTAIDPVIVVFKIRKYLIIYDFCVMRNHIMENYMAHGSEFKPPVIHHTVSQYNSKTDLPQK